MATKKKTTSKPKTTAKSKPKKPVTPVKKQRSVAGQIFYWLPRAIVIFYPALLVGQMFVSNVYEGGVHLASFILMMMLTVFATGFVMTAWKSPKIGGLIVTFVGVTIMIGSTSYDVGFNMAGMVLVGAPITLAGLLFILEGYTPVVKKGRRRVANRRKN